MDTDTPRDPSEPTEADLHKIEEQVRDLTDAIFGETSRAFGWVANRAFRDAVEDSLWCSIRGALIRQHKDGFYAGFVHRDDAARKVQGEWMSALLSGALAVNPDKRAE